MRCQNVVKGHDIDTSKGVVTEHHQAAGSDRKGQLIAALEQPEIP